MSKKYLAFMGIILLLLTACDLGTGKTSTGLADKPIQLNFKDVRNVPPAPEGYEQYNGQWSTADSAKISTLSGHNVTADNRAVTWDYDDYKHLHATTNYANHTGICSMISVTNPDVPHNTETDLGFFYAYIMIFNAGRDKWIQAGWSEVSWKNDKRYITVYDTETYTWYFYEEFLLNENNSYLFTITYQEDGKWAAWLWWDNKWVLLRFCSIGLSTPELTTQVAEVCSVSHNWFSVPNVNFDFSCLLVNNRWNLWTPNYPVTESAFNVKPYYMNWTNSYFKGVFYYQQ